jgi:DNA-3-methyladenine glycosylase
MFGEVGRAYVYFTYGNHFCVNVTARSSKDIAGAVLIRALQPLEGTDIMKRFRKSDDDLCLTSGPGKLTQAMNINKCHNEADMRDPKSPLHIEFGVEPPAVIATQRIGITHALDKKWRFVAANKGDKSYFPNKYASRKT